MKCLRSEFGGGSGYEEFFDLTTSFVRVGLCPGKSTAYISVIESDGVKLKLARRDCVDYQPTIWLARTEVIQFTDPSVIVFSQEIFDLSTVAPQQYASLLVCRSKGGGADYVKVWASRNSTTLALLAPIASLSNGGAVGMLPGAVEKRSYDGSLSAIIPAVPVGALQFTNGLPTEQNGHASVFVSGTAGVLVERTKKEGLVVIDNLECWSQERPAGL